MRIAEVEVFNFSELDEKAQEKAISDFYIYNGLDVESDMIKEDMLEYLKSNGVDVENLYFSLNHCQGDGVCFTGSINFDHENWGDIVQEIEKVSKNYEVDFKISHKGNYYHEYSMLYDMELLWYDDDGYEIINDEKWIDIYNNIVDTLKEYSVNMRDEGYKKFEYYRSKEYFEEFSEVNEWEYEKGGKLFKS